MPAAEILYKLVGDWCSFDVSCRLEHPPLAIMVSDAVQSDAATNTCLLDICCGTGTIGQIYSEQVKRVLGFELVEQAVNDAKANAAMNSALEKGGGTVD